MLGKKKQVLRYNMVTDFVTLVTENQTALSYVIKCTTKENSPN